MQRGTIIKEGRSWVLRYWEHQIRDGIRVRVKVHKRLAPIGPAYPDKRSVEPLAWKHLEPINTKLQIPEAATPITAFIEQVYLPHVRQFLRPATYKNYSRDEYTHHFKHRLGDVRLRDFRTAHGQRLLSAIAKDNPDIGHKTLLRLKSFLSGVFKHAKAEGYMDEENPMRDVTLPRTVRRSRFVGKRYDLREITDLIEGVQSDDYAGRTAFCVVAVAAFTGLRLAELQALQWGDYDGVRLTVKRTRWRTKQSLPKTEASEASVPVLPVLQRLIEYYRDYLRGLGKPMKPTDWMFAGHKGAAPMNLPNLVRRTIKPNLDRKMELHNVPEWRGWHALRRSLATNLFSLGVPPKIIQAILRHSDLSVTMEIYVDVPEGESRAALDKLSRIVGESDEEPR